MNIAFRMQPQRWVVGVWNTLEIQKSGIQVGLRLDSCLSNCPRVRIRQWPVKRGHSLQDNQSEYGQKDPSRTVTQSLKQGYVTSGAHFH